MPPAAASSRPVGDLLREWRRHRRLSQLELATEAEISTRHLSFVESGRSTPSRDMILHLAEYLDIPLRERNALLVAAGFAPVYAERALDDPAFETVRRTIELLLKGMEPYPALAVDRYWQLITANGAALRLMAGLPASLLEAPANVLRASLHPAGLAPRIRNLAQWRAHLLERLQRQVDASQDPKLVALLRELQGYPAPALEPGYTVDAGGRIAVPMELEVDGAVLSMLSTTTVFGTPTDVMLQELAIEAFVPADEATAEKLRAMAQ
ncbi:helix-turn-helix domain-containing protein [Dyella sp. LX-66]|uniref:helix-turn-helix domain-containing protein n=1 Tax=unclassified Dyella TaxID=2634549 RepID=UPI001BE0C75A|nr:MULTISPECIES: helix-turn-helix transcriptional regulator [unclassified Dyella]MBT2116115.1 helix-turn-helix domain-containing protein [Dyella sp. LX-1]MBT2138125.1 helix-turn-helix domain-containing protein [Dyella sp. LX-66]